MLLRYSKKIGQKNILPRLSTSEKIAAKSALGKIYYNLGAIYKDLGRNKESKKYLNKTRESSYK